MFVATLEYITYPRKSSYSADDYIIGKYKTSSENVPAKFREDKKVITFTAKGTGIPVEKKFDTLLEGKWNYNEKYGLELYVNNADIVPPDDEEGIKLYLSRFLKGCGKKTAQRIYDKFGKNTLLVLNKEPSRLLEVEGIRKRQLQRMLEDFENTKKYQELTVLLSDFSVSKKMIEKISAVLGDDAVGKIKSNPFVLEKFRGLSFEILDTMALRFGCAPAEPKRIKAAIRTCLKMAMTGSHNLFTDTKLQNGGNVFVNQYTLREASLRLLNARADSKVTVKDITSIFWDMSKNYELLGENGNVYLPDNFYHEQTIANNIVETLMYSNCKHYKDEEISDVICRAENVLGIHLSNNQKEAVAMVLKNSVSVITGGAGTGKTTVLKVILFCLKALGNISDEDVMLAAPTGKAAIRMTESTSYMASTIHKALGLVGEEDFYQKEEDIATLDAKFIVCDEASMIDQFLAYRLFVAAPIDKCRVLFVGDVGQLPSIGAGNFLNDVISSGVIPVTTLNVIFRQAQESNIVRNSHNIYEGVKFIECKNDFLYTKELDPYFIADLLIKKYIEEVQSYGKDEVVILSPVRKNGTLSVNTLNERIQEIANPLTYGQKEHRFHGILFREKDKVMNLKNRDVTTVDGYNVDICNGDTGTVKRIFSTEDGFMCRISFSNDRTIDFDSDDMKDVTLAYAMTVHKSQGSEFKSVIMPLSYVFPNTMMTRNLVYTGITRAKEKINIIGDINVLYKAIDNNSCIRRNTALATKIRQRYDKEKEI